MASTTPLTVSLASALKTTRSRQRDLEQLSPFELKDYLITLAKENQQTAAITMLNAGRGAGARVWHARRGGGFVLGGGGVAGPPRHSRGALWLLRTL